VNRAAALLAVAALGFGCASLRTTPDFADLAPVATDDARVVALAGALAATASDRRTLVGVADVSLESPDLKLSRPQRIAIARPASLRIEILGLFDQVAGILTTDGRHYQLYDPTLGAVEQGRTRPGLLWQVARVDLEPDEAIDLLLGAPLDGRLRFEAARTRPEGSLLLAYRDPATGGRRIFEFDGDARLVEVRQRDAGDGLVWEARYADYRPVGERSFAHAIDIRFPDQDSEATFRFSAAELNRDLPASAFELPRATP